MLLSCTLEIVSRGPLDLPGWLWIPSLKAIRIPISGTITADQSLFKALGRKRERAGKTARVELRPRPPYVLGVPLVCVKIGAPQNVCLCVCDTRLDTTARKIKRTATATPFEELSFSVCVSFHFPFENKPQKGAGGGPSALGPLGLEAFVELFASPIAGVGVRAFRPIPAGVDPFPICNPHMAAKETACFVSLREREREGRREGGRVKSFFAALTEDDGWTPQTQAGEVVYGVLATGMNNLNLSWYLNHSEEPNIVFQDAEEDGGYNSFITKPLDGIFPVE
ncbi:unnamed protein product [Effrenium voratum]|uniref:Uncharacterized protein n=1 Tax=Effrenium voratum TaxID=2562239 RepID=A0AA36NA25_9DINO|nr:unnamed protein product [Effrenium voratum]